VYLGTVGVSWNFIEKYSDIVAPINELSKKGIVFEWNQGCDEAQAKV
jgi:hypothetical protein